MKVSTEYELSPGDENAPAAAAAPVRTRTRDLSIKSLAF